MLMVKFIDLFKNIKNNIHSNIKKRRIDPKDKFLNNIHYTVGAIIKKDNKYLIINRNLFPPGYAGIAGHVQKNESIIEALKREVKEETNYKIIKHKLLFHEIIKNNECRTGIKTHEWHLFDCKCEGKLKILKSEEKSIHYLTKNQINQLYKERKLEPVWGYWFKKLKII